MKDMNINKTRKCNKDNNLVVPITITKTQTDLTENEVQLDFFTNSAYD